MTNYWQDNFGREVMRNSSSDVWDVALREWDLIDVYWSTIGTHCICSHAIHEVCVMKNRVNSNDIIVGNCCVEKFPQFESDKDERKLAFQALSKDRVNSSLIELSYKLGYINEWERDFSLDTMRKKKLTQRQSYYRNIIYRKMKQRMRNSNIRDLNFGEILNEQEKT
jgi:hypothetical protein